MVVVVVVVPLVVYVHSDAFVAGMRRQFLSAKTRPSQAAPIREDAPSLPFVISIMAAAVSTSVPGGAPQS